MAVYVIFSDTYNFQLGDFDQICADEVIARREVRDLKRMGFPEAHFRRATSEEAVYEWVYAKEGGTSRARFPKA